MEWNVPDKDGHTKIEKYGHVIPVPDEPELEQGSNHILQWFWNLHARRQPGFSGLSPLTFQDIDAWQRLTGTITRPEEIEAILAMDSAYMQAVHDKREEEKNSG